MAHAKAQDELQKRYEEGSQSLEAPEVEHMVAQADKMMGKPARMLIAQAGLDHSTTTSFSLLDHGCGTARARRDQWINVDATVLDAQDSGLPKHSFSHVTMNFAMHIIPDPAAVLRDTLRILRPGGLVAFSVPHANNGHGGGWVPDLRSALESLPFQTLFPDPMPVSLHGKPEWVEPEGIEAELVRHGFVDVKIETVDSIHQVANAEGFLASFGMMVKWIINTYWTVEQKEQYEDDFYKTLVEHLRIKHSGKGWDLKSTAILVTARTPQ
ncbi:S-adenosyl-L-methionine-dependent methyltransferase [Fusarium agapanthi]|uniref:S-adenosyl-L-methionine-dependent methyltransferase n=1 Tax=Fusarium agapanthi TaxID=1803897 RepID=A0A9P5E6L5_9HYPO|nr:S-adenosyl-L-methionine-dependent methyltransferase [Fusarium agapanthi]